MIKAAKYEIARQFDRQDLDDIVEFVSGKASDEFLDKLLARRLETIEGRQLINALARAERLGYNAEDIIEQNGQVGREHVIPSLPHARPPALMTPTPHHQTPQSAPMIPSQGRTAAPQHYPGTAAGMAVSSAASSAEHLDRLGVVHCDRCWRPCSGAEALQYVRLMDHKSPVYADSFLAPNEESVRQTDRQLGSWQGHMPPLRLSVWQSDRLDLPR